MSALTSRLVACGAGYSGLGQRTKWPTRQSLGVDGAADRKGDASTSSQFRRAEADPDRLQAAGLSFWRDHQEACLSADFNHPAGLPCELGASLSPSAAFCGRATSRRTARCELGAEALLRFMRSVAC